MMQATPEQTEQIQAASAALHSILGDALLAVYLHGSAASGRLRPQSDIDLLAVVDRDLTEDQRDDLLTALLRLSSRHTAAPDGRRCLEVMVFRRSDLARAVFPARAEFIYGEWLRAAFEAGRKPMPAHDPEYTLVLAQARREAMSLSGLGRDELLPEVSSKDVRQAMRDLLPALLEGLHGDERNVLLTLTRMWRTASTGEFVPKDTAAIWAMPQLGGQDASTLDHARQAYLGEIVDDWCGRDDAARRLADLLGRQIIRAMAA